MDCLPELLQWRLFRSCWQTFVAVGTRISSKIMSSYSDEYQKISYRQAGRLPQGKIAKGVIDKTKGPAAQTDKKAKSSIPSKFETVLHKGPRRRMDLARKILGLKLVVMKTQVLASITTQMRRACYGTHTKTRALQTSKGTVD